MADRTCQSCGKEFAKPRDLRRHANRARPCVGVPTADSTPNKTCQYCHKLFTQASSRARHEKNSCRLAANAETRVPHTELPDVRDELEGLKAQLATQAAQLALLIAASQNQSQGQRPPEPAASQTTALVGYPAPGEATQTQVVNQVGVVQNVVNDHRQQTYVTVVLSELEQADLGALQQLVGRIGEEKREGSEAAWRWMLEGARAVHGGRVGGLLVPNKKEDRVLRVRGGKWSEEQTTAAVEKPTERLLWELVSGVNKGLMGVHWTELPEKEGAYLGLDKGLKRLMEEKRGELVGKGGPLYVVGVENAADWRREGKKMPKPGEAAELEVEAEPVPGPAE